MAAAAGADGAPPSGGGEPVVARFRVSKACDACKSVRRRCDGGTPQCDRCAARGVACVYTDSGRRRGPQRTAADGERRARPPPVLAAARVVMVKETRKRRAAGPPLKKSPSADAFANYVPERTAAALGASLPVVPVELDGPGTSVGPAGSPYAPAVGLSAQLPNAYAPSNPWEPANTTVQHRWHAMDPMARFQTVPIGGGFLEAEADLGQQGELFPRSASMAISALVAGHEDLGLRVGQTPASWRSPGAANGYGSPHRKGLSGARLTGSPPLWDLDMSISHDALLMGLMNSSGFQPVRALPMVPAPQLQPGMFDDLPPVPPSDTITHILELFFERVNPSLTHIVHPPSFFSRQGDGGELLLVFAMLAAAAPALPTSGQAVSLSFFRRAQRLLQPLLTSLLRGQRPTAAQLAAVCIMSWHASCAFNTSQLGFQLGMFLVVLLRMNGIVRPGASESAELERRRAALESGGAPNPRAQYRTVAERETVRRVVWQMFCLDRVGSTVTPFPGQYGAIPAVADSDVAGLLLPCNEAVWLASSDPAAIAAGLGGAAREMLSADAAGLVAAAGKGRTWWKLRLHAVLGKVVAYHWHCIKNSIDPLQNPELVSAMRQRVLALLEEHEQLQPIHLRPFSLLNPAPTAADVWSAIALRLAYISLHTPRKGSGLDPSVLLSSVTWLGSPDFPACAEHSSRVADLVAKLDAVDPLRDHMDFCLQVPAAQIAGTIAFVRMVVAQRAVALLLATGSRSDAVLARVEASAELARAHLRLLRRHQALTGRMSRMAAQMALFLRTMEEGSQQFGRILELAHTGVSAEARAPVIWTEQGLLITHESAGRVLVDWADAVGAEHEDEWASPAPKRSETIGGEVQSPASQSTAASDATASAVEWKWRLGGVPELERRLQMHAGPGSGP